MKAKAFNKMTKVDQQIYLAKEFCEFMNSMSLSAYKDGFYLEDLLDDLACMGLCLVPDFDLDASSAYFKLLKEKSASKSHAS
jgi:hypothetical protein